MKNYQTKIFSRSRIATIDVCALGLRKHHVIVLLEIDITESRKKIKDHKKNKEQISFFAWLIKAISKSIKENITVAAFLKGKRKLIEFNDINISVAVEKEINGNRVPIPLVVEKTNEKTVREISSQISKAKEQTLTNKDIVLRRKSNRLEHIYYLLPGFIRRMFWFYLIKHPHFAFNKMGNVSVTSVSRIGGANAWFIPISVHPICFGIGNVIKKPVVRNDNIEIREVLNMTVLLDHDVVDGMKMARFLRSLSDNIEKGVEL